jgi:hypothetical protein
MPDNRIPFSFTQQSALLRLAIALGAVALIWLAIWSLLQ